MPKMNDDVEVFNLGGVGNFQFSAAKPETLTSVEYTLATIVVDTTGSVAGFSNELLSSLKCAVESCYKSPRADNLLVRVVKFNSSIGIEEIHGFLPLNKIDLNTYSLCGIGGCTNLFDACFSSIKASIKYAEILSKDDFIVNGAVYVITDGDDNASKMTINEIKKVLNDGISSESMESIHTVLVGVNATYFAQKLNDFATGIGINQFVDVSDATPEKLARLANFISRSISSQSQALGTGGPSQNLTF